VSYQVGNNLSSLVLADFNGDGKIDIAVTDVFLNAVAILLNNGDGTFQAAAKYAAGPEPFSMAVGDFNSDGKLDLAVTNVCDLTQNDFMCASENAQISVLLGNGDGSFRYPGTYFPGGAPFMLTVQDVNGDGKPDLVISNVITSLAFPQNVSAMLGNGDGTFQPAIQYPISGYSVAGADFNGDGITDLLAVSDFGFAEMLGSGAGFLAPVNYFVSKRFLVQGGLVVADVNGDGRPDLVFADGTSVGVFLNAGGLSRRATAITLTSSQNPVQTTVPLTITASITPADMQLQGSVTFYIDGQPVKVSGQPPIGQLNSFNQATCCAPTSPNPMSVGTHSVVAVYSGDTNSQASTSLAFTQTVTSLSTATALASSKNPSISNQPVTLTATVTSATEAPFGSVTFFDGANSLGALALTATSQTESMAKLPVTNLTVGTHTISASYSGTSDGFFAPSGSSSLQQVVNPNLNLLFANGTPASLTVSAGQTAVYQLTIGGAGYAGQANLSCTGAPIGATCTVAPESLLITATSSTALNVSLATTSRPTSSLQRWRGIYVWAFILLALIAWGGSESGKRPITKRALVASLLFSLSILISACGGGNSTGSSSQMGTPGGTYTIVVTATSGTASESVSLTLTVQ
jgi:hypothetical protein